MYNTFILVKRVGFYPEFGPTGTKWIKNKAYEDLSGNLKIFVQLKTDESLGCSVDTFMEKFYFHDLKPGGAACSIGLGEIFTLF